MFLSGFWMIVDMNINYKDIDFGIFFYLVFSKMKKLVFFLGSW